jgi:hypothetical protein
VATAIPYVLWLEPGVLTMAAGVVFAIVGGILVARRPDNVLGRLLVSMAAVWALGEGAYTYLASEAVGALPANDFVSWLNVWAFYPMLPLVVAVAAMFPSGRVASAWMRWTVRAAVTVAIVDVAARMVVPIPPDQSPFGEEFAASPWSVEVLAPLGPLVEIFAISRWRW